MAEPTRPAALTKLREWEDVDPAVHERWDTGHPEDGCKWPGPPVCTESRADGELRETILRNLGRPLDDSCEIRLVERDVEGGWSEFTVEHEHEIEVWVHEGQQAQLAWHTNSLFADRALAAFIQWATSGLGGILA